MPDEPTQHKRRWRFYRTEAGNEPVRDFLSQLADVDRANVATAMQDITVRGLIAARHLRGDIYEVRAQGETQSFRVLFATEGQYNHILLALEALSKKTQKTPPHAITLASVRLADWRQRGRHP